MKRLGQIQANGKTYQLHKGVRPGIYRLESVAGATPVRIEVKNHNVEPQLIERLQQAEIPGHVVANGKRHEYTTTVRGNELNVTLNGIRSNFTADEPVPLMDPFTGIVILAVTAMVCVTVITVVASGGSIEVEVEVGDNSASIKADGDKKEE